MRLKPGAPGICMYVPPPGIAAPLVGAKTPTMNGVIVAEIDKRSKCVNKNIG
jgi:hypothetical protein